MVEHITKYKCDNCKAEMHELEYKETVKITIGVSIPNPKGGCNDYNAISMALCDKCAEELGVINAEIHNGLMGTRERIRDVIEKSKDKILRMVFNKQSKGGN